MHMFAPLSLPRTQLSVDTAGVCSRSRLTYEEALPAYVFKENSCGHSH